MRSFAPHTTDEQGGEGAKKSEIFADIINGSPLKTHHSDGLFQVGDTVLLPEYGGTKIELEDKEYTLLREHDIVATLAKE